MYQPHRFIQQVLMVVSIKYVNVVEVEIARERGWVWGVLSFPSLCAFLASLNIKDWKLKTCSCLILFLISFANGSEWWKPTYSKFSGMIFPFRNIHKLSFTNIIKDAWLNLHCDYIRKLLKATDFNLSLRVLKIL